MEKEDPYNFITNKAGELSSGEPPVRGHDKGFQEMAKLDGSEERTGPRRLRPGVRISSEK